MSLSSFIIRLIFLALPGIVAFKLCKRLRGRTPKRQWEDVLDVALFAIFSYTLATVFQGSVSLAKFLVAKYWSHSLPPTNSALSWTSAINYDAARTFSQFLDSGSSLDWSQILFALLCAPLVAFVVTYLYKYRIINRVGQKIGCTRRYGDEDVWEFFQDTCAFGQWLYVRDHKLNLLYYGAIDAFSDNEKPRELILTNVTIYSNKDPKTPLYFTNKMYICRRRDDLTIELPDFEKEKRVTDPNAHQEDHADAQPITTQHAPTLHDPHAHK